MAISEFVILRGNRSAKHFRFGEDQIKFADLLFVILMNGILSVNGKSFENGSIIHHLPEISKGKEETGGGLGGPVTKTLVSCYT